MNNEPTPKSLLSPEAPKGDFCKSLIISTPPLGTGAYIQEWIRYSLFGAGSTIKQYFTFNHLLIILHSIVRYFLTNFAPY